MIIDTNRTVTEILPAIDSAIGFAGRINAWESIVKSVLSENSRQFSIKIQGLDIKSDGTYTAALTSTLKDSPIVIRTIIAFDTDRNEITIDCRSFAFNNTQYGKFTSTLVRNWGIEILMGKHTAISNIAIYVSDHILECAFSTIMSEKAHPFFRHIDALSTLLDFEDSGFCMNNEDIAVTAALLCGSE